MRRWSLFVVGIALFPALLSAQTRTYTFTTLAGRPPGTPFLDAHAMRSDVNGNLFVLDGSHAVIRRITPQGEITVVAGVLDTFGQPTEGPAGVARLGIGYGIAVAPGGELYYTQFNQNAIWKVGTDGTVSIIAGSTAPGSADGTGAAASFNQPNDLVADPSGNVYIADVGNNTIRRMTPAGVVTTVAGTAGVTGSADGVGAAASFTSLSGLAALSDGSIYLIDNDTIRHLTPDGTVTTMAGTPGQSGEVDGSGSTVRLLNYEKIAVDAAGNAYFGHCSIRWMPAGSNSVGTIAGFADECGTSDSIATVAAIESVTGLTLDPSGRIWFLSLPQGDNGATILRSFMPPAGWLFTSLPVGAPAGTTDGTGSAASFTNPRSIAYQNHSLYETDATLLRTVTTGGTVKTVAQLGDVTRAVAVDNAGVAYVAAGCGIVKVASNGTVTPIAGVVPSAPAGNCGAIDATGAAARFSAPAGIAVAANGSTIYVADTGNSTIRSVSSSGVTTTIAGAAGQTGSADGVGTTSRFNGPAGLALDAAGNLFVADAGNHTIRKVAADGTVTTLAGMAGARGSADGSGAAARFDTPSGLALDSAFNLYVADSGNSTIRMIAPDGAVTTLAGLAGFMGSIDGDPNTPWETRFRLPLGVAVDSVQDLYVADTGNNTIRHGHGLLNAVGPSILMQPVPVSIVGGVQAQFNVVASGVPAPGYRWQVSTNAGAGWTFLTDNATYTGSTTPTLTIPSTPGTLNGSMYRVVIQNSAGTVTSTAVLLTVNAVVVSPSALRFAAAKAGASGSITAVTPAQGVAVTFTALPSTWTAVSDQPWLQIGGATGNGPGSFIVGVSDPGNTIGGSTSLSATVTVTSGSGLVATLAVALTVDLTNPSKAPFGSFDTPVSQSAAYQGSIAVTGWALDDIGVDHVEIWRDAVAGETTPVYPGPGPGTGKIFISNATFVSGARPDVEGKYSTLPNAQRAGWGYLLLSYGLWNRGNGTYKLYAFAFDVDGTVTTLGTKAITVNNASATKPFGTIDTPSYGGTVSGTIQNFGWALTPGTSCSITNPNVQVSIDSGALTPVVYGDNRTDIAGAFPGYTNADAAGGHSTLDTTTLSNGVHTIGWFVTDSCGRADGIGSRFFTVVNAASISMPGLKTRPTTDVTDAGRSFSSGADVGRSFSSGADVGRSFSSGADVGRSFSSGAPGDLATDGTRVVRVAQTERIEVPLPGDAPYTAGPLPIGSTFDAATNTFMWQPAPGFLGVYDLSFTAGSRVEKLRVVVGPAIRMVIDTPSAGTTLRASGFTVAGWAVDLGSLDAAGIDTLHVWAYPVTGAAPVFVGVARPGGVRPDVMQLYGASFTGAGFTLDGRLAPGTYDLVVYAHSAATNSFEAAQTVRVIVR